MYSFNQETNKKQKCEFKRFSIFLLALCFFPFICLYSEYFPSNFSLFSFPLLKTTLQLRIDK